jgi:NAD(P)-dependent dehydrogenase (short-subunit alcohol dehydrogenase family)
MGLATVRRFLAERWSVLALDRDEAALDAAAADLASDRLLTAAVDVTDRAGLQAVLERVPNDLPLRAVVNAAGVYPPTTLANFTEAAYRRTFDVNVLGTLNVCAVTAPRLAAAGGGAIVNFASVDGLPPRPASSSTAPRRLRSCRSRGRWRPSWPPPASPSTAWRPAGSTPRATPRPDEWPRSPHPSHWAVSPGPTKSPTGCTSSSMDRTSPGRPW